MNGNQQFDATYKKVACEGIEYSINEEKKTASVTGYQSSKTEIIIPRSIKHESDEYIVTSISNRAFAGSKIRSVAFEPNSELRIIERDAFACSSLVSILIPSHVTQICERAFYECEQLTRVEFEPNSELRIIGRIAFLCTNLTSLTIPASAVDLDKEWFIGADKLSHIEVESGNARYLSVNGKCIIGKSDITQEDYDTFIFLTRDSVEVNVPKNIKIIGTYAFSQTKLTSILIPSQVTKICESAFSLCCQLSKVEFAPNSELRIIEIEAFANSGLTSILIPAHVTQICKRAFSSCIKLARVEFEPKSELKKIEYCAFYSTDFASIKIPASVVDLNDGWCCGMYKLSHVEVESGNARYLSFDGKYIIGKSDITQDNYDTLVFWARNSIKANIPRNIKIIGSYAFSQSKLTRILIPSQVTKICTSAFSWCYNLAQVEFEPNSELQVIKQYAFHLSKLAYIMIPKHVTRIGEGAFYRCRQLSHVEFEPNSELQTIKKYAFSESQLSSIVIPTHATQINKYAFSSCSQLQIFEIDRNLLEESIDIITFNKSKIIMFPTLKKLH